MKYISEVRENSILGIETNLALNSKVFCKEMVTKTIFQKLDNKTSIKLKLMTE